MKLPKEIMLSRDDAPNRKEPAVQGLVEWFAGDRPFGAPPSSQPEAPICSCPVAVQPRHSSWRTFY